MSILKEYGTSKTFYPTNIVKDENFDREAWRQKLIDYISSRKAKDFAKHFPQIATYNLEKEVFEWDIEKLKLEDDLSLTFKYNICRNTPQ